MQQQFFDLVKAGNIRPPLVHCCLTVHGLLTWGKSHPHDAVAVGFTRGLAQAKFFPLEKGTIKACNFSKIVFAENSAQIGKETNQNLAGPEKFLTFPIDGTAAPSQSRNAF